MKEALAFLTPLGGARAPSPRALPWFPLVGALLGLALGVIWVVSERWWPPIVAAAIVVTADLAITGMLHVDGLADAADGLVPHLAAERRLDVMAQPDVGAFGVAAVGAALLLRWAALTTLTPSVLLIAALWSSSRSLMALAATRLRYVRHPGLATAFLGGPRAPVTAAAGTGLAAALAAAVAWEVPAGPAAVVIGTAAGAAVLALAVRRLGGFSGDVLGAAGVVTETVGLAIASARW